MKEIIMYGADWCGDCIRSKAFLQEHAIPFEYVDLVERSDMVEEVLKRNQGRHVIPTVVFPDGTHLTEPTDEELGAKLGLA